MDDSETDSDRTSDPRDIDGAMVLEAELEVISSARGPARAALIREFVRDHVLTELRAHRRALLEAGIYDLAELHPMVGHFLEAFYQGQCLECGAGLEGVDLDSDTGGDGALSSLLHAPVGRSPTKDGRNRLIFDAVQSYVLAGNSIAGATRQVSERVRSGTLDGIEQQVLSTRTVLNIYRGILRTEQLED